MTREEILAMPAGPKLDALIAEKVMGWTSYESHLTCEDFGTRGEPLIFWNPPGMTSAGATLPPFSTDIAAAWQVVERLIERKVLLWVHVSPAGNYRCECRQVVQSEVTKSWYQRRAADVIAETAPLAICHAALLATLEN